MVDWSLTITSKTKPNVTLWTTNTLPQFLRQSATFKSAEEDEEKSLIYINNILSSESIDFPPLFGENTAISLFGSGKPIRLQKCNTRCFLVVKKN